MELTYPELESADVQRSLAGVEYPHYSLRGSYRPGCTEPWIAQLICSLLAAHGGRVVLECGGYLGTTSVWLASTLDRMGGGTLYVAELDEQRGHAIDDRLSALKLSVAQHIVYRGDALRCIAGFQDACIDFCFLDDDHTKPHVRRELTALWPKMRKGGLILLHDVHGSTDLQSVVSEFGGYSLDLPRLGPAGGLGVIQCR
jgi:predicted O-methyltransferase YrrM